MGVGEGEGAGFSATARPLFHTNFFPDLTQVYLIFETVLVEFNFVQAVPAIEDEFANGINTKNRALARNATKGNLTRLTSRDYRA